MKNDFIKNWSDTLKQFQKVIGSKPVNFAIKVNIALDMLEASLSALVEMGMISKLGVLMEASTTDGKRISKKYSIGKKEVQGEDGYVEETPCLRISRTEEDE